MVTKATFDEAVIISSKEIFKLFVMNKKKTAVLEYKSIPSINVQFHFVLSRYGRM